MNTIRFSITGAVATCAALIAGMLTVGTTVVNAEEEIASDANNRFAINLYKTTFKRKFRKESLFLSLQHFECTCYDH